MSVANPTAISPAAGRNARSVVVPTLIAGTAAGAGTTVAAAAVHAAGVPLAVGGSMIPLPGFGQMTLLGAFIGGVLLAVFNRRSAAPRLRFLQTAAALTALSCIPAATWPPDAATKLVLVTLHLLAAAMIVPVLARRTDA